MLNPMDCDFWKQTRLSARGWVPLTILEPVPQTPQMNRTIRLEVQTQASFSFTLEDAPREFGHQSSFSFWRSEANTSSRSDQVSSTELQEEKIGLTSNEACSLPRHPAGQRRLRSVQK